MPKTKPSSASLPRSSPSKQAANSAAGGAVAIVVSRYNASITDALLAGARAAFAQSGGGDDLLTVIDSPGSYELPVLVDAAAESGRFAGVVALGCIIKGETSHDHHLASAVAHGLINVSLLTGVPVAFGVLTVDTPKQAKDRAGGKHGNKGAEAMQALLLTIAQIDALQDADDEDQPAARDRSTAAARLFPDKAAPRRTGSKGTR